MSRFGLTILCLQLLTVSFYSKGQISIPGDLFNRIDKINDTTFLNLYRSISDATSDGFTTLPVYSKLSLNTAYPRGYNDGPVWKGKGITWELHGGFTYKQKFFSVTFHPALFHSQNRDFGLAPNGNQSLRPERYKYAGGIDYVQRFGFDPLTVFHPGQSEIKFNFGKFSSSISTQNYSAGPSRYNPIVLSRQAGGFPHVRMGLDPTEIRFKQVSMFDVEAQFLAGILNESAYFDQNTLNDRRYFNGLFIAISPSIIPNLTLGLNKTLYKDTQFFEWQDLTSVIYVFDSGVRGDSINTNDTFDQLASISADWKFPEVGFRAYGEFAKNDFTGNIRWTLSEPEHSRAYTIGFEKIVNLKQDHFILTYEHSNLSRNHSYLWRANPSFYVHHINRQGYTNNGQLLGAGIGPGGNSDHFEIEYHHDRFILDILFQRIEFNKDFFVTDIQGITNHDVEYTVSFNMQKEFDRMFIGLESAYSYNLKRYFVSDQFNFHFALSGKFKL